MEELISNITKDIISKKELKNLDEQFVKTKLLLFLKKKPILKRKLEENNCNKKSKEYKFVIKEMRKSLREIYGVFITKDYSKKDFILNELKNAKEKTEREQIIDKLLSLHQSSKERIPIYSEVYKQIFEITGKPNKILDLGCGLNPLSYHYLGCKPYYIASDMNIKDTDFLKRFFDQEEITGKTISLDLTTNYQALEKYKVDVCFMFKLLDSLETVKRNLSKEIIRKINSNFLVISFSKKTLGGKKVIDERKRSWIYKILNENKVKYQKIEFLNEFFVVGKIE